MKHLLFFFLLSACYFENPPRTYPPPMEYKWTDADNAPSPLLDDTDTDEDEDDEETEETEERLIYFMD